MSSQRRRVLALAGVAALHTGALILLFEETRTREVEAGATAPPLMLTLLSPPEPQRPTRPGASGRTAHREAVPESPAAPEIPSAEISTTPHAPVDWRAEASSVAERLAESRELHARQMRALTPRSKMFAPPPRKRPGIPWDYAATHRVQPLGGLTTAININDNCGIVLFIIIPFAGGCSLEKIPARGDLFEHMHDPPDEEPLP